MRRLGDEWRKRYKTPPLRAWRRAVKHGFYRGFPEVTRSPRSKLRKWLKRILE